MSAGKNMHKHKGILILRVEFLKSNNSTKQVQMIIMVPDHLKKKKKKGAPTLISNIFYTNTHSFNWIIPEIEITSIWKMLYVQQKIIEVNYDPVNPIMQFFAKNVRAVNTVNVNDKTLNNSTKTAK